jgi:class 3 adenylate cyclase
MNPPVRSPPFESWLELPDGGTFWLKERCAIGRLPDNDLVLDEPALSRHHALLAGSAAGYVLSDLHSRNGTFLNRSAVTRPVPVRDGDEVRFGDVAVRFRCKRKMFGLVAPASPAEGAPTQRLDEVHERECWLLLVDVVGFTALNEKIGSAAAVRRMQGWITAVRPLIERQGGRINAYLGDAIFTYWLAEDAKPAQLHGALRELEAWRPHSPLPFRYVVHRGKVLFTHSDRGEELTGQDVNLLFRSEKIAKGFESSAMLSAAAVAALGLEDRCPCYGRSAVDGMADFVSFYGLPRDFVAPPQSG